MANSYVSLDALKGPSALNTSEDGRLLALLEGVSRAIDRYCNRHFYVLNAARVFDGSGTERLLLPDLISVDTDGVRSDDNGDRTFETVWAAADYALLPPNADPGTAGNTQSRPYTSIEAARGARSAWPAGRRTVRIAGQWGWQRHLSRGSRDPGRSCVRYDDQHSSLEPDGRGRRPYAAHRLGADIRPQRQRGYAGGR